MSAGANVVFVGANGMSGHLAAYLLKQSPLISQLSLVDADDTEDIGLDLSHINTKCRIRWFDSLVNSPQAFEVIFSLE